MVAAWDSGGGGAGELAQCVARDQHGVQYGLVVE
jgi:hypothetical protein